MSTDSTEVEFGETPEWKQFASKWTIPDEISPDLLLYHYTSTGAANSMFLSKQFWATYAKHSNDSTEFSHGIDLFIEEIKAFQFCFVSPNNRDLIEELIGFLTEEKTSPKIKPFIFCLSELGDLLSQWRGYTPNSSGVAIGFQCKELEFDEFHTLKKVVYDDGTKRQRARSIIQEFDKLVQGELAKFGNHISPPHGRSLFFKLLQAIYVQAACFKHEAFNEEKEWRIVIYCADKSQILSRNRGIDLVLYTTWDFKASAVASVVCGPKCSSSTNETLESLVDKKQFNFKIARSSIPFQ
ncbi:MAG: DUF2971 domain-containing protein [Bacteriovoracia bacterium]